jgi:TP901 family phage tail tape measure protein
VTKALTDVLVDYHMKASDAANVTSQMIVAISHGKTNLEDFSGAFANIVPAASAAGISFKDVASALAQMTNHGFTADRASMNLAQALRSLLNPTHTMQKAFGEYGVSAQELRAKLHGPNGLTDAMEYLAKAAGKAGKEGTPEFAAALKLLMGTAPGANAALTTVGNNFKATSDTIRDVGKATADANGNVQGFAEVQKTLSFQVTQVIDKLKAFVAQIGMALIPVLSEALGWLSKHQTVLKVLAGIIGGVLLVAIAAYTASMVAAAAATIAATWPILAVIAVIAGLVIGFKLLYDHSKAFRDFVHVMWVGIQAIWDQAKKHWDLIVAGIMGPLGILFLYFRHHTDQLKKMWADTWHGMQHAWKEFEGGPLKDIMKAVAELQKFWSAHGQQIMREVQTDWKIISAVISVNVTIIWETVKGVFTALMSFWRLTWGLFRDTVRLVWFFMKDFITGAMHAIHDVIALVMDIIHGKWSKVWGDLKKISNDSIHDTIRIIKDLTSNFGTLLYDAGKNIIKGLINGIDSMLGGLKNILGNTASSIRSFFPFSPAKEGPLSGEGSPDKSGAKISSMLAEGIASGAGRVAAATAVVADSAHRKVSSHHTHHTHHPRHHQQTINQQLTHLAHSEGHMSTAALDKAVEKLMRQHRLTVAQLTKSMQILLAKGGHHVTTKKIDGLIAEMKKQYKGLTSKGILDAAIKELEHHPHLNTSQLMSRVAKDLHAQARKTAASSSSSGGGDAQTGYLSDLTWQAGGVRYTVGGAGRSTGPGRTAAGSTSGSTSVAAGGSSGQHLTVSFAPMHIEVDLKDSSGTFSRHQMQALRNAIRVKGGDVQKVLGH